MKRYAKTHPYEWEPDMEQWLLTVPLGSNIKKCTQYMAACLNAWQRNYEWMYRVQLEIPHDLYLNPKATQVNKHLTHFAQMQADCQVYWKQTGKERRGMKRQCAAIARTARSSHDAQQLTHALEVHEWTHGERARKKGMSENCKADVGKYERDHIIL